VKLLLEQCRDRVARTATSGPGSEVVRHGGVGIRAGRLARKIRDGRHAAARYQEDRDGTP